jgi:hypothetical protein
MAASRLARLSKIRLARFQQMIEPDVGRFASHLVEDLLVRRHVENGAIRGTIASRLGAVAWGPHLGRKQRFAMLAESRRWRANQTERRLSYHPAGNLRSRPANRP